MLALPWTREVVPSARAFDVVCAGEAPWTVMLDAPRSRGRFRPGGGAVTAALALARKDLSVGLASVLSDDTAGRALREEIAAAGIDVSGVVLSPPTRGLYLASGDAREVEPFRDEDVAVVVPSTWAAEVLLLSGVSPLVSQGGALCRAARAARRAGSFVVVDLNARWHLWRGRDPRTILTILREADVVFGCAEDLLGLNMDVPTVRAAMRPSAVFVMHDGMGRASAVGPFGEVVSSVTDGRWLQPRTDGDAFAVAICAELARSRQHTAGELWERALERGRIAAFGC